MGKPTTTEGQAHKAHSPIGMALVLTEAAFCIPGGLKPKVSLCLGSVRNALLAEAGPNLGAARLAAGEALDACMENRILDERPETGLIYTIAHLLASDELNNLHALAPAGAGACGFASLEG